MFMVVDTTRNFRNERFDQNINNCSTIRTERETCLVNCVDSVYKETLHYSTQQHTEPSQCWQGLSLHSVSMGCKSVIPKCYVVDGMIWVDNPAFLSLVEASIAHRQVASGIPQVPVFPSRSFH
jgi:hypothetical protein